MSIPIQYDFKNDDIRVPRYRLAKIFLSNVSSSSVSCPTSSISLMQFKVASNTVVNLSQSYISYNLSMTGSAGLYPVLNTEGSDFRWCQFGSSSGLFLADINYNDVVQHTLTPGNTSMTEYLSRDQMHDHFPALVDPRQNVLPYSRDGLSAGTLTSSANFFDRQHVLIGSTPGSGLTIAKQIPLSNFKKSILSDVRDQVFSQDMYLNLYSNYATRTSFYCSDPSNVNTTASQTTQPLTMSNVYLYLSIQENISLRDVLLTSLAQGKLKYKIPWIQVYRYSIAQGSQTASASLTLSRNFGSVLKAATVAVYSGNELNGAAAYDACNFGGNKVQSISTSINGRPTTDSVVYCQNANSSITPSAAPGGASLFAGVTSFADDYREIYCKFLKNSSVSGYGAYQENWQYSDMFGLLANDSYNFTNENCIVDGFPLSSDLLYAVNLSCGMTANSASTSYANGLLLYVIIETQRQVEVTPNEIFLSS